MKTYILTFSTHFPKSHPKAGQPTFFVEKISRREKLHTIRANAELWRKRIREVQEGKAEIRLRYWSGKPYNSPQIEFGCVGKEEGVGFQLLQFNGDIMAPTIDHWNHPDSELLAKNDGLYFNEWLDWFESYDLNKDMAIIQLSWYRYVDDKFELIQH